MPQADILIIEDDESESMLIQEALKGSALANNTYAVKNAHEAKKFLNQKDDYADKPRPDLIIMDLKMPDVDGHAFLKSIKQDRKFQTIPIIVLTSSDHNDDIANSYKLHANCYVVKPVNFKKFKSVVSVITGFWLGVARLPPKTKV